jgi:hypothetical protein
MVGPVFVAVAPPAFPSTTSTRLALRSMQRGASLCAARDLGHGGGNATTAYTADLFDMDPDNKAEECFKALFAKAHKLPALESWTYDKLLGISLESSADVILADLGAAQGHRMIPWFRDFYKVMQDSGLDLRWTALGVVDADIASARSVIEWGGELQNTVDYVIVHNHFQDGVASSWENPKLDATDRFTDDTVLTCAVVLRIKLLKFEHRVEVKRWLGIS